MQNHWKYYSSEFVVGWMVCVRSEYVIHLALSKTLDCSVFTFHHFAKGMKSYVQVGLKWIIHKEHLWGLNYAHFKKSTVFSTTLLYTHEEQSHGLYKKPTNYHMNG